MKNVVLVAPFLGTTMVHALRCFADLEGVRLGLITQEGVERIPADLKPKIAGHYRIADALSAEQIAEGGRAFQKEWGQVDRLEGYLEQMQVPLGQARDILDIDGMRETAALNFRDKNRMKKVLAEAGLPVARQARITGAADLERFVSEVGFPIVVKPLDGAGAKNTVRVSDTEELYQALNQLLPSPSSPIQAEEFITGEEHTFETATVNGKTAWASSTFYLPGPLHVLENPWMQYCLLLPREQEMPHVASFKPMNRQALDALGLQNGISHMEWFLRKDGRPVIGEVGARPPGANIMLLNSAAHDIDMWAAWARLQVFREWQVPERKMAAGCAFVRGMGRGNAVKAVHGLADVQESLKGLVYQAKLPRVGQPRSSHYEGEGWIVVRHPETKGVVEALRTIVTTLKIDMG